jgi:hypothetical protein
MNHFDLHVGPWPLGALNGRVHHRARKRVAMPFSDRSSAGRRLAEPLMFLPSEDVVVLGLPRGGVPVAFEVARALGAPLDVIVVRKLGSLSSRSWVWGRSARAGCGCSTTRCSEPRE